MKPSFLGSIKRFKWIFFENETIILIQHTICNLCDSDKHPRMRFPLSFPIYTWLLPFPADLSGTTFIADYISDCWRVVKYFEMVGVIVQGYTNHQSIHWFGIYRTWYTVSLGVSFYFWSLLFENKNAKNTCHFSTSLKDWIYNWWLSKLQ